MNNSYERRRPAQQPADFPLPEKPGLLRCFSFAIPIAIVLWGSIAILIWALRGGR
jgi:hypothetical protein